MKIHAVINDVTSRIIARSQKTRAIYLNHIQAATEQGKYRSQLACGNLAHAFAACPQSEKDILSGDTQPNIAIISAYNDMLSAHAPYVDYPEVIKKTAKENGAMAQFSGGVPAMCDGVTQGQDGMELSLFSRDVIAMSAAIGLSHNMYDGVCYLGICDKIVPGLLIGALSFGHLPSIFIPAGPMPSGLPNTEKARIRQEYAAGKLDRSALLEAESQSYHSKGTCTFYGTANSNQMLVEIMGLQLPGSSFINPDEPLRHALTQDAVKKLLAIIDEPVPIGEIMTEKTLVNAMVGLLATGGSTNHTLHLMAIAQAAGIQLSWQDLSDLSDVVPTLTRVYPNGTADINHFQAAGGMGYLMRQLLDAGLLHADVKTITGGDLYDYLKEPFLDGENVTYKDGVHESLDADILRPYDQPFTKNGGMKLLHGNIGRAVTKISAVKAEHHKVTAPAVVFEHQDDFIQSFKEGKLHKDFIAVLRFQGPKANGMPELHKLTPPLGVLQDLGFKVALVTDGRMSGASGKVPAAIHLCPEALDSGLIAKVVDGDMITYDAVTGDLSIDIDEPTFAARAAASKPSYLNAYSMGRNLFAPMRHIVGDAETGASIFTQIDAEA